MNHESAGQSRSTEAVRVLTVKANTEVVVRFLGGIDGIITHWKGKQCRPCPGVQQCGPGHERDRTIWKGYAPVLRWSEGQQTWFYAVLEATEGLALALSGRQLRGEEWLLSRPQDDDKPAPVNSCLLSSGGADLLPDAFDFRPVVEHVYNSRKILWGVANPARPRLLMPPVQLAGPVRELIEQVGAEAAEEEARIKDERRRLAEKLRQARASIETKIIPNGRH